MLETASGLKAFSVGKPSPIMLRAARKDLALPTDQTVVIGDTMETDILGGVQLNYKTVLVLTGSTRRDDMMRYAYRPDLIVDSIADLDLRVLEHDFGAGSAVPAAQVPASHRTRRQPVAAGAL
jgi:NagD protein